MYLLGDVRQVEVGGEGPCQLGRIGRVQLGEQCRRSPAVMSQQIADPLEEVEQIGALLPDQRAAEKRVEPAEVAAQPSVRIRRVRSSGAG